MYSITVIRLNAVTMVFENTELHSLLLEGDLKKELQKREVSEEGLLKVISLKKGERTTIHLQNEGKLWFCYIFKL